jgi:quercetin dioxygenase-like cupin family protein
MNKVVVAGTGEDGRSTVVDTKVIPEPSSAEFTSVAGQGYGGRRFPLFQAENPPRIERAVSAPLLSGDGADSRTMWSLLYMPPGAGAEMHRADVLSYSVVLSGTIDLILESEHVRLEAGDCLVCEGAAHGWASDGGALLSSVAVTLDRS